MIDIVVGAIYNPDINSRAEAFFAAIGVEFNVEPSVQVDPELGQKIKITQGVVMPSSHHFRDTILGLAPKFGIKPEDVEAMEFQCAGNEE